MIKTILFDLDGTLISFDQNEFIKLYFSGIMKKFIPHGYPGEVIMNAVYEGVDAMYNNDGSITNEEAFWNRFSYFLPDNLYFFEKTFLDFYNNEFNQIKSIIKENEYCKRALEVSKSKNFELVIATNPLFPRVATYNRILWGKYNIDDFIYISTFENSSYCKPNLKYYEEILNKINRKPEECLMVGNDALEDMVASKLGMATFLITDNLISEKNIDISKFNKGTYKDFFEYIKSL